MGEHTKHRRTNGESQTAEKAQGKLVPFSLRERLYELKGARLSVWFCHWLHSDRNGLSWPDLETLEDFTGYKTENCYAGASIAQKGRLVDSSGQTAKEARK